MSKLVGPSVTAADFAALFNEARREVIRLRWRYIRPHLRQLSFTTPADYALDVKAFCVLSHAALEQCFEDIALATAIHETSRFSAGGNASRTLMALLLFHVPSKTPSMMAETRAARAFDTLRLALEEAKVAFSRRVFDNNGMTFEHLGRLLEPVGIDISLSADEQTAVTELTSARGEHAHGYVAQRILSPEDASLQVYRCLAMARRIAEAAAVMCGSPMAGLKYVRMP